MSGEDASRQETETRNARLRKQIDSMLSDLRRCTEDLHQKQAEAAASTYEISSEDGRVTVKVDATGALQELALSPKAFERSTPDRLAKTITSVIREATGTAQTHLQAQFEPMTRDVPDLTDFVPGAPSFKDFVNTNPLTPPPDPAAERAKRTGAEPPTPASDDPPKQSRRRGAASDGYDDEPPDSFLVGGGR